MPTFDDQEESLMISVRNYANSTTATTGDWWFDTSGTSTNAACSTLIWRSWNAEFTTDSAATYVRMQRPYPQPAAPAFWAGRAPVGRSDRFEEVEGANSRAEALLREHLTERQKYDLSTKGYFDVVSFRSQRFYRIKRGRARNVFQLDGPHGREIKQICCHPNERVPDADTMLAQKLLIELNEELFLKTANITDLVTGRYQMGQGIQATG